MAEFQNLVKLPAWGRLVNYANAQIATRHESLGVPIVELKEQMELNFKLGEAAGIKLFTKIPEIMMEAAEAILSKADEEQEDDDS